MTPLTLSPVGPRQVGNGGRGRVHRGGRGRGGGAPDGRVVPGGGRPGAAARGGGRAHGAARGRRGRAQEVTAFPRGRGRDTSQFFFPRDTCFPSRTFLSTGENFVVFFSFLLLSLSLPFSLDLRSIFLGGKKWAEGGRKRRPSVRQYASAGAAQLRRVVCVKGKATVQQEFGRRRHTLFFHFHSHPLSEPKRTV